MSEAERILKTHEEQTRSGSIFPVLAPYPIFQSSSSGPPTIGGRIAIVTCMDPRINPELIPSFQRGTCLIIRNAGGVVTDDVIRSLVVSSEFLGATEFIVTNHTDCAMLKFKDQELQEKLVKKYARTQGP